MGHTVKLKSLITRINRHLVKTQERLCKARPNEVEALGEYYLVDGAQKAICRCRLEPIAFAAERRILMPDDIVEVATAPVVEAEAMALARLTKTRKF
ncbi:hypothetical protein [Beijerinckia sp. L45]|uniref:hypothetical protein n=1 Tax=Beijerinckia sp. L45 TaxID=1641855 RepID=UPI00131D1896|nr:hypothetical protein [Beijerinckia sp. L45]